VGLYAEGPLVALLSLVHLGFALTVFILCGPRRSKPWGASVKLLAAMICTVRPCTSSMLTSFKKEELIEPARDTGRLVCQQVHIVEESPIAAQRTSDVSRACPFNLLIQGYWPWAITALP